MRFETILLVISFAILISEGARIQRLDRHVRYKRSDGEKDLSEETLDMVDDIVQGLKNNYNCP